MASEVRSLKVKFCKSEEPGEVEAHVVEACCAAWEPKEGDMFTWPVRRCLARRDDKGQLRLGIAEPFGDLITCPWTVCPSCGATVVVVEELPILDTPPPWNGQFYRENFK